MYSIIEEVQIYYFQIKVLKELLFPEDMESISCQWERSNCPMVLQMIKLAYDCAKIGLEWF